LLGLSYLWTGSINGVKLKFGQLGCSAVLIDLADAVADELAVPFDRISLEMLFRGLYHFHHAYSQGLLTRFCFAAPENNNLDVMKIGKSSTLNLSPFPSP